MSVPTRQTSPVPDWPHGTGLRELLRQTGRYWLLLPVLLVILAAGALLLVQRTALPPAEPAKTQAAAAAVTPRQLIDALERDGFRPAGPGASVEVWLATPEFYQVTGNKPPASAEKGPSVVFMVAETVHTGALAQQPPAPVVLADGHRLNPPIDTIVLADSPHHRTSLLVYAVAANGTLTVTPGTRQVLMVFSAPGGVESSGNVLSWDLPLRYNDSYSSSSVTIGTPAGGEATANAPRVAPHGLTWAAILAIMAGMLLALSPCLIGLGLYFVSVLAGTTGETGTAAGASLAAARTHIAQTGIAFAAGFTVVYTIGGAAAGFVGQSLQNLGLLTTWVQPFSMAAGAVIIIMAVRVAWNARAPLVCRLPMAPLFGRPRRTGVLGSAVMGFTFAAGCLSCFSATVLPALLLYASSVGSVVYGAVLLMVFSIGISLPVLGLSFGVARAKPLLIWLQRQSQGLSLLSAAVMAAFGVLMVTYQYHNATGLLARWLGL